jgi:hypothetical protein
MLFKRVSAPSTKPAHPTELVVELGKTFFTGVGRILLDRLVEALSRRRRISQLFVGTESRERRNTVSGKLSGAVYTHIENPVMELSHIRARHLCSG